MESLCTNFSTPEFVAIFWNPPQKKKKTKFIKRLFSDIEFCDIVTNNLCELCKSVMIFISIWYFFQLCNRLLILNSVYIDNNVFKVFALRRIENLFGTLGFPSATMFRDVIQNLLLLCAYNCKWRYIPSQRSDDIWQTRRPPPAHAASPPHSV